MTVRTNSSPRLSRASRNACGLSIVPPDSVTIELIGSACFRVAPASGRHRSARARSPADPSARGRSRRPDCCGAAPSARAARSGLLLPSFSFQRRHVRRRRRRRRAEQVLEHPLAAQHDRGPVGIGGHRQDARLAEQPLPRRIGHGDAAEVAAVDVLDAVVPREPLVQEGVVGAQQLEHDCDRRAPGSRRRARSPCAIASRSVSSKSGNEVRIGILRLDVAHVQPLAHEVVRSSASPRGSAIMRAHLLRTSTPGPSAGPCAASVEQLVVGDALPQEERQPRGQLEIAQTVDRRRLSRSAGRARCRNRNVGDDSSASSARSMPASKSPSLLPTRVQSATAPARRRRSPAGDRPGAPACSRSSARRRLRPARPVGRQTKIRRRLGVSCADVAS